MGKSRRDDFPICPKFGGCYLFFPNRASLSIAANLAEGNGRFTKGDRRNFFIIARGSAQECVPLLELTRRKGFLDEPAHAALRRRIEMIAKMIGGLIKGVANRQV